jgi:hypothetical protein
VAVAFDRPTSAGLIDQPPFPGFEILCCQYISRPKRVWLTALSSKKTSLLHRSTLHAPCPIFSFHHAPSARQFTGFGPIVFCSCRYVANRTKLLGFDLASLITLKNVVFAKQNGSSFDGWTYQNGIDTNTTGNVLFQSQVQATQEMLTYVDSAGHAIVKVDNTTSGVGDPTFGRPSVKLLSDATVPMGSLTIIDAVHMPFGVNIYIPRQLHVYLYPLVQCSVWPSVWMEGPNWPYTGEIDIVENVNLATNNQYSLHTVQGCQHPSAADSTNIETGTLVQADCFNQTNGNTGCLVKDASADSFGAGFAAQGGGAFAVQWDDTGIFIYFFNRSAIPADLSTSNPDPTGWGLPSAAYPSSSCNTSQFFSPQTLIIVRVSMSN